MIGRIEWLPIGHIPHGYRRVFTIFHERSLRHVVTFVPMPYEQVFHIRELGRPDEIADPSLWWGFSMIVRLVSRGVLLGLDNPDTADDGYMQLRPEALVKNDMVPISTYDAAYLSGTLDFVYRDGKFKFQA